VCRCLIRDHIFDAQIAQSVEQWTENPRVDGSNPSLGTIFPVVNYLNKNQIGCKANGQSRALILSKIQMSFQY
jgi:hypothetical protein|tara:strand:- start:284 stop:502 length:219 start_codon:yes stop_codon:yes gene_type:complete